MKAAIDDLRSRLSKKQLPQGERRARVERAIQRLSVASTAIDYLLADTPDRRSVVVRRLITPRPTTRGLVPQGPSQPETPDGATPAGRDDCEDEEGVAPCATQQDLDDAEQFADELEAEAQLVEQDMEAAEWEVVAYCNNNPHACGGGSPLPEGASPALDYNAEGTPGGDDSAVTPCVPETPCWDLIGHTRNAINWVARPAIGSLWETAKNVAGVTLRKLGWRTAAAITGFGTAALVGAYALECLVTELLTPGALVSPGCEVSSADGVAWREESYTAPRP